MLLLATRKAIPDDVYDSWNKEPCIIGSDSESEIESPGEGDKKDADEIISIHDTDSLGSDIDIKLTSSLLDLNLYEDSGSKDKDKGRAKFTNPGTPQKPGRSGQIYFLCAILSIPGQASALACFSLQYSPHLRSRSYETVSLFKTFSSSKFSWVLDCSVLKAYTVVFQVAIAPADIMRPCKCSYQRR